jgi:hypothetical protein
MSDLWLFILGLIITIVTLTAVILIGRSEARDAAALSRAETPADESADAGAPYAAP